MYSHIHDILPWEEKRKRPLTGERQFTALLPWRFALSHFPSPVPFLLRNPSTLELKVYRLVYYLVDTYTIPDTFPKILYFFVYVYCLRILL